MDTCMGVSRKVIERRGDSFVVEVADEPLDKAVIDDGSEPPVNTEPLDGFYEGAYGGSIGSDCRIRRYDHLHP